MVVADVIAGDVAAGAVVAASAESFVALLDEQAPSNAAADRATATASVVRVWRMRIMGVPPDGMGVARLRIRASERINARLNFFSPVS
jgi:hypothetical protein